ncbi:hypothetical protein ACFV1L_11100 [Kitasatospora sp. NPDC059646]|uniref:hypothetical protein n=1 Tax=Kitasatospora sp. NPDC059646 TaxID=3346893 RepID=UPI0036BB6BDF
MTSPDRGPAHPVGAGLPGPDVEEPLAEPVFVDQSGLRGRLLRGLGWPVSVVGAVLAVAMGGSLIGVQADAPAMEIPAQPAQSPPASAPVAPSASPSPSPSPSASRNASHSPSPGAKTSSKPSTGARGATPSGGSAKHP